MALTSALHTSFAGIRNTEAKIYTTSSNVTNADKPGYTRKEIETNYLSVNDQTVAFSTSLETVDYNLYLFENLIEDTTAASFHDTISTYLTQYSAQLGTTNGDNSLAAFVDDFATNLAQLSATPEDASLKSNVIDAAEILTRELNRVSDSIQEYRLQVDAEIERSVTEINDSLQKIADINEMIIEANVAGQSTANLEDDRRVELEKIAEFIDIDYFENNDGEIQIYTGGRPLLDSHAHTITYAANTNLDKTTLYPGGFSAIDLDGFDMTPVITSGRVGGLIDLRDTLLVSEQAKFDEFTNVMIREVNRVSNQGASLPSRTTLLGDVTGVAAGDALAATGNFRIATLDSYGVVQNTADFNMAGYATVGDMIADINATLGPDVTASIAAPDGQLQIVANNPGEGVAMNELTSDVGVDNLGVSHYFGLNNIFDGTGSDDVVVSQYLLDNPEFLAAGALSSAALAVGDVGVSPGDSSITNDLRDSLTGNFTFNAAGNFATQTESVDKYIDKIISDAAFSAKNATDKVAISQSLMDETKSTLENLSGVNIDEEMAFLIDLEAKYEASATMLATIQELFDTLLSAVR